MGAVSAVLIRTVVPLMLAVSACSVDGDPSPAEIDLSTLDVGNYPTQPLDVDAVHVETDGPILEGLRMAQVVALPFEIDPKLIHSWGADVIETPKRAADTFAISNVNLPVLERHGMITGYDVAHADQPFPSDVAPTETDATVTRIFLIRFPGEDAARDAARDIEQTDFAVSPDNQPVEVPNYSQAYAHWRPGIKTMAGTLAEGEFVVSVFVQHPVADGPAMADRLAAIFDAQLPLLADFEPTQPAEIRDLPRDPDDVLRRTFTTGPRDQQLPISSRDYAAWSGRATEQYRPLDVEALRTAWDDGDVDAVGISGSTNLFRFADAAGAEGFGSAWIDSNPAGVEALDGPAQLPGSRCAARAAEPDRPAIARCYVTFERYGAFVSGGTIEDARQQAAAQYALLVNTA